MNWPRISIIFTSIFYHTPASVARYAAALTGRSWTVSAHAKDIWTTPEWEKREKLLDADWLVTCSAYARDHLAALDFSGEKVELVYHGLDGDRFPASPDRKPLRDGTDSEDPLRILCVGRAVEKKGHDILLDALARLPSAINWRLWHIGGGELRDKLKKQAQRLGISDRVVWFGALPQGDVKDRYRKADLFVLASRIGKDGDRDGLPNVLMEAQSQGLACVATNVSAIHELIIDGETGVLVPPEDPEAMATAITELSANAERRLFLGKSGEARVRSVFPLPLVSTDWRKNWARRKRLPVATPPKRRADCFLRPDEAGVVAGPVRRPRDGPQPDRRAGTPSPSGYCDGIRQPGR